MTNEEKRENCRISHERILIENINAKIKVFKIMKYPYRNIHIAIVEKDIF